MRHIWHRFTLRDLWRLSKVDLVASCVPHRLAAVGAKPYDRQSWVVHEARPGGARWQWGPVALPDGVLSYRSCWCARRRVSPIVDRANDKRRAVRIHWPPGRVRSTVEYHLSR